MIDNYTVIIPARYASTRLPGKVLLDIAGKPIIQHVYDTACTSHAGQVLIATDDQRIADTAQSFGADVIMTSANHTSGTDRLAEVITLTAEPDESIIVNLQGDEIGMPPELIDQVADILVRNNDGKMATLCEVIDNENDINDPNVVKVVFDKNNVAMYFSRLAIPWHQSIKTKEYFRHIGIYAYRAGFLKQFSQSRPCVLEEKESLEQLRVLYNGEKIHIEEAIAPSGIGVDTEVDLMRARKLFGDLTS